LSGSQPAGQPAGRWGADVAEASARFGIPAEWIRRVIQAESSGRTSWLGRPVVSPAGAMGLMQLMPATWRDMRDTLGLGPDPHDPRDNIIAGTAYLRAMYDRFGYPGLFAA
jgi:soluble lytic murein transglycosylase-like protein